MTKDVAMKIVQELREATPEQRIEAWQYLHDNRIAYGLGGWFKLTAEELLRKGKVKDNGVIRF